MRVVTLGNFSSGLLLPARDCQFLFTCFPFRTVFQLEFSNKQPVGTEFVGRYFLTAEASRSFSCTSFNISFARAAFRQYRSVVHYFLSLDQSCY